MDYSADSAALQRRRHENLDEYVKDAPFTSLAIAAAAGFIFGGGAKSRIGLAMLAIVGRIAIQGAASSFIAAIATGSHHNGRPNSANLDSEGYDKRRRDFQE